MVLHVTSEGESRESLDRIPGIETIIIPNGVKSPDEVTPKDADGMLRLLFLGRLHPKKGIENLLHACKSLNRDQRPRWSLTIAGAGDPFYTNDLRTLVTELELSHQVKMIGKVSAQAKRTVFENADIVVVPSHTENFGMVVAEALAHGVPVIASKGTPWGRVEEKKCGLWVENDPENLARAIGQMAYMPLREMGQKGREWMQRDFGWEFVAKQIVVLYQSLVNKKRRNGAKPRLSEQNES